MFQLPNLILCLPLAFLTVQLIFLPDKNNSIVTLVQGQELPYPDLNTWYYSMQLFSMTESSVPIIPDNITLNPYSLTLRIQLSTVILVSPSEDTRDIDEESRSLAFKKHWVNILNISLKLFRLQFYHLKMRKLSSKNVPMTLWCLILDLLMRWSALPQSTRPARCSYNTYAIMMWLWNVTS